MRGQFRRIIGKDDLQTEEHTMNRALVDDSVRLKLNEFHSQTELCDKEGRVLGVFTPSKGPQEYDWSKLNISEEELDRRCNEPGERTTAEVLKALCEP